MADDRNARGHRLITSYGNPTVKAARALREKKHRKDARQFLAEGLRILTEARDAGILPQQLFYAGDSANHPLAAALIADVAARGGDIIATTPDILSKLSGKDNPQTLIGIYPDHATPLNAIDRHSADQWFVVQAMRDPGNLGTILRTADAVGAGGVILIDDCVDPFSVEAVRASMGAIFTRRIVQSPWPEFLNWLRAGPGQLIGTSLNDAQDYRAVAYERPAFLLIGNEAQGLPAAYESACDVRAKIPMRGKADSLNAAIACAVMAYAILAQHDGKQ